MPMTKDLKEIILDIYFNDLLQNSFTVWIIFSTDNQRFPDEKVPIFYLPAATKFFFTLTIADEI